MSHLALQRVIVRMLYDPPFAEWVRLDSAAALRDVKLRDDELQWLLALDPRAFRVDDLRRSRSLAGLLEEFPASCAIVARHDRSAENLDQFFSSRRFHEDLQEGRSLSVSFGTWLQELTPHTPAEDSMSPWTVWLLPLARMETRIALARRHAATPVPVAEGQIRRAGGVELTLAPAGASRAFQELIGWLHAHPQGFPDAVVSWEEPTPPPPPSPGSSQEHLLVDGRGGMDGEAHVEQLSPELFSVLDRCERALSWESFASICADLGAEREDARQILESLTADGLLLAPRPDRRTERPSV